MRTTRGLFVVFGILLLAGGCTREVQAELVIDGHRFTVEIADTPELRQQGLMFRDELAPDAGMLFVFPDARTRSFWMKDTSIPLSIAYIAADGRILEMYDMEPFSLQPVRSRFPARFALEVNQGRFKELGIEPGDRVQLPERLRVD